ncbi:hypothetical protein BV898_02129 [Hypsibius exemplaris]|uniref:Chitin-binding type-2 domain-containing protein n=1 Tax=Hypsibius exemplaris TaxID=2072580 RepID=A0A1W0XA40_HYPEX|nr:hypothetical protein BV898_02129 [Hypsibius exemplaris]
MVVDRVTIGATTSSARPLRTGNTLSRDAVKNYCICTASAGIWATYGFANYTFALFNKFCLPESYSPMMCQPRDMTAVTPTPAAWAAPPVDVVAMCNEINCDGRSTKATYFPLASCSLYYCFSYNKEVLKHREGITCDAGQYFDLCPVSSICRAMRALQRC